MNMLWYMAKVCAALVIPPLRKRVPLLVRSYPAPPPGKPRRLAWRESLTSNLIMYRYLRGR